MVSFSKVCLRTLHTTAFLLYSFCTLSLSVVFGLCPPLVLFGVVSVTFPLLVLPGVVFMAASTFGVAWCGVHGCVHLWCYLVWCPWLCPPLALPGVVSVAVSTFGVAWRGVRGCFHPPSFLGLGEDYI